MTREHEFFKRLFQYNIEGKYEKKLPIFPVTTGNAKETGEMEFHTFDKTLE